MQNITINNIELLSEKEKNIANKLLGEYFPRIKRLVRNEISLRVYIKEYEKQGKRKKYSIDIEAVTPMKLFRAKASDWDFAKTLHKVLNKILNEVEHKLHSSEQH